MSERMVALRDDQLILMRGFRSFLLAGQAGSCFPLCIETFEGECCQTLEPHCLVAVSAPEGGSLQAAWMLLELVRSHHIPLLVMPPAHPGSRRLRYVVSAGEDILLSCNITRGTHPEQHLLCSSSDLSGIRLTGMPGGIKVFDLPDGIALTVVLASALR